MQIDTTTKYNRDLINKAALIYWKKYFATSFIISILGVVLALVLIFLLDSKDWITGTILSISLIGCIIFLLSFFIYRKRSFSIFQEMESPIVKWTFTDESIIAESDAGKSEFKWKIIKELVKSDSLWLLVYKNSSYSTFPLSGVSENVLNFLSSKVIDNGGKIT
jgi:hypothetical protein